METASMTALVCAFSRAYHTKMNETNILDDPIAQKLLSSAEYDRIAKQMSAGISYFYPDFVGSAEEGLRQIVDRQLSPAPLARAAFCKKALSVAADIGTRQYLMLGAGLDTFSYRQPDWARRLAIFELDREASIQDKRRRLDAAGISIPENVRLIAADLTKPLWFLSLSSAAGFDRQLRSFCSLLGLVYYLPKACFSQLLAALSALLPDGSSLVFDYPVSDDTGSSTSSAEKTAQLAEGAGEKMYASYSYEELESLLSQQNFLIYEHLTPEEMTRQYFSRYNKKNPAHPMDAPEKVNYCLAVKRRCATR